MYSCAETYSMNYDYDYTLYRDIHIAAIQAFRLQLQGRDSAVYGGIDYSCIVLTETRREARDAIRSIDDAARLPH